MRFQQTMEDTLALCTEFIYFCLDDILVSSKSKSDHLDHLRRVLNEMRLYLYEKNLFLPDHNWIVGGEFTNAILAKTFEEVDLEATPPYSLCMEYIDNISPYIQRFVH